MRWFRDRAAHAAALDSRLPSLSAPSCGLLFRNGGRGELSICFSPAPEPTVSTQHTTLSCRESRLPDLQLSRAVRPGRNLTPGPDFLRRLQWGPESRRGKTLSSPRC